MFNGDCPKCHRSNITVLDRMINNEWKCFKIFDRSKLPKGMKFNWEFINWITF